MEEMEAKLYIFHSPEINLLFLILSFYNQIFLLVFLSDIIHLSLDAFAHYKYQKTLTG